MVDQDQPSAGTQDPDHLIDRGDLRWAFGAGTVLTSLCWFTALGFGARLLTAFSCPSSWRLSGDQLTYFTR